VPKPSHRKRADGTDCWRVRFQLNGTTASETFDAEAAAKKFCTLVDTLGPVRALELLDEGTAPVHAAPGRTLDEVFDRYMAWKGRKNRHGEYVGKVKTDRTLADNRRDYDNWIGPWFGDRDIDTITEVDVAAWVEAMEPRLSAKTIADRHSLLHQIYKWASSGSRAITLNNPCLVTELPARSKKLPKGLKPAEWALLHQAAQEVDPDAADLLLFFVASGWRWSEATALAVWEVELDESGRVFVNMGRVVRRNAAGEHVIVADAKSLAGERRIKMGAAAGEMLLRRIDGKRPDDLVFTSAAGTRWSYSHFSGNIWQRAKGSRAKRVRILERAKELGLERADQVTLHWLRHTHVGMLILGGNVSLPEIQRRVGHASINTTVNIYGRMVDDVSEDALDALDAMLGVGVTRPAVEAGPVISGEVVP
jgi:integrase